MADFSEVKIERHKHPDLKVTEKDIAESGRFPNFPLVDYFEKLVQTSSGREFKFNAVIAGGRGPNVWDREIQVQVWHVIPGPSPIISRFRRSRPNSTTAPSFRLSRWTDMAEPLTESNLVHEWVEFTLYQMPCCAHLLCWVNPRRPNFCPECGKSTGGGRLLSGCEVRQDLNARLTLHQERAA